jgi:hypothetical protein
MGLGRFPKTYFLAHLGGESQPGLHRFAEEAGNRFLRLSAGDTLYLAQRIPVQAGQTYTLIIDLRSEQKRARLETPLCERHLLHSFQCVWQGLSVPGQGHAWQRRERKFNSEEVGAGPWLWRRPVELTLYNPGPETVVDVDNIHLLDSQGRELLHNGDFSRGGDYWFFKTHSHLPWHIKNLWVHVLFEQGWLGLGSFLLLVTVLLAYLWKRLWHGDPLAAVLFAAASGMLSVGMFDSILDTPRLTTLFFTLLFFGAVVEGGLLERPGRNSPHG